MKQKNGKVLHLTGWAAAAALAFSFVVMPPLLASAPVEAAVQTVPGNETVLYADDIAETPDINAISGKEAAKLALDALAVQGFDIQEFQSQPFEIRYIAETVPAGEPVWAVVFRSDRQGYASAFGTELDEETRAKIAAIGEVETCTDENGVPGIRAWYSYTLYTLVEINAFSGKYIRHGESVVSLGSPLVMEKTKWVPTTEKAWEAERQKQEMLQKEMEQ